MSEQVKNYYISVQGLEELIRVHEIDYNQILERIKTQSMELMKIQSQTNPKHNYVIPIGKINYFLIEKIDEHEVETKKED